MKCPRCKGKGSSKNIEIHDYCSFCDGKDILDWIEYLFGVDNIKLDTCPLCNSLMVNYEAYPYLWDPIKKHPATDENNCMIPDKTKPKIRVLRCLKHGVFI